MRSFLLAAQTKDGRETRVLNDGKSFALKAAKVLFKAAVAAKANPAGPGFPVLVLIEVGKGIVERHSRKMGLNVGPGVSAPPAVDVEAEKVPTLPAGKPPKSPRKPRAAKVAVVPDASAPSPQVDETKDDVELSKAEEALQLNAAAAGATPEASSGQLI